eukprot:8670331-Ditylum_brightwellii.AAC.1
MDHSIVLETVPDESTMQVAGAVVALGSDLKKCFPEKSKFGAVSKIKFYGRVLLSAVHMHA